MLLQDSAHPTFMYCLIPAFHPTLSKSSLFALQEAEQEVQEEGDGEEGE